MNDKDRMTYLIALIACSWNTVMQSCTANAYFKYQIDLEKNLIDLLLPTSYRQINFKLIDKVIGYFAKSSLTRFNFLIILHFYFRFIQTQ